MTTEIELNQAIDKNVEIVSSDDDFGEFEEVDQTEVESKVDEIIENNNEIPFKSISIYQTESANDNIIQLLDKIFTQKSSSEDKETTSDEFQLDERAEQIFERLTSKEEYALKPTIWKQSMIYKQLLMNLEIPQEVIVTERDSMSAGSSSTKDLYDFNETVLKDGDIERILSQVPSFGQLQIDKKSEEFGNRLSQTSASIANIKQELTSDEESLEYLERLNAHKQQLLELLSIWNEHTEDVKQDNELFTSYIENLIGNTQKLRRETRMSKKGKKGKKKF